MAKRTAQHIGEDQLVYGMPKHMAGVSTQESLAQFKKAEAEYESSNQAQPSDPKGDYYWTVHPKSKACDKGQALAGKEFMEKPERPHPNCKCEIKKHPLRRPKRYLNGSLNKHAQHRFIGGRHITVTARYNSGGFGGGVGITPNHADYQGCYIPPGCSHSFEFNSEVETPVAWMLDFWALGSDNCQYAYTIIYEDWSKD